jgi:hypothetical protein
MKKMNLVIPTGVYAVLFSTENPAHRPTLKLPAYHTRAFVSFTEIGL